MGRSILLAYIVIVVQGIFWFNIIHQEIASVLLFEMPLIFMVSGAAYCLSDQNRKSTGCVKNYTKWVFGRCIRILVPYWGYALVCSLITLMYSDFINIFPALFAWLNPMQHGGGYTTSMLNWHLWFVLPFLVVTVLLPLIVSLKVFPKRLPLVAYFIVATLLVYASDSIDTSKAGHVQMIVFYLIWAAFGFSLATQQVNFGTKSHLAVFTISLATLASAYILFPSYFSLNMQENKFPPNTIFFLFCCAWVSIILVLLKRIDRKCTSTLGNSQLLKPFLSAGYSIYLWQGLGYSIAQWISSKLYLSTLIAFPFAVVFTIAVSIPRQSRGL